MERYLIYLIIQETYAQPIVSMGFSDVDTMLKYAKETLKIDVNNIIMVVDNVYFVRTEKKETE